MWKKSYVKVGRSSYSALNRINWVKKGSVSLVVPMAIALPKVAAPATILKIKSRMEIPRLAPVVAFEATPASSPALDIFTQQREAL